MSLRNLFLKPATIVVACLSATGLAAEMPLMPDADYALQFGDVVVRADVATDQTTLSYPSDPTRSPWAIPATPRMFSLSPSGDEILAIHEGKHIQLVEPFLFVATLYRRDGTGFTFRHVELSQLLRTNNLPRDDQGLRWLDGYRAESDGWKLDLSDGKTVTISYR